MANTSIFNAFERFWLHVTTALGNKSDLGHDHENATQTNDGFMSAEDKIQLGNLSNVVEQKSQVQFITWEDDD